MAGWWENCITTTFIESNNLRQNDCQSFFFINIFFLKSCFVFWFLSFRRAAPLISTPDASLFPLNNSAVIYFFFSSCGVPPPHRRRFPLPGMLEMTHLWLLCISLHRSLIHANVGVSSSWQPTRATSPGVINYSCTGLAPWQDGEIFPLFLIFKSSYSLFFCLFHFLKHKSP